MKKGAICCYISLCSRSLWFAKMEGVVTSAAPPRELRQSDLPVFHGYRLIGWIELYEEDTDPMSASGPSMIDLRFAEKLRLLQALAYRQQYEFAVISTLGGAYHLCNKPKVALILAQKQEALGRKLGSTVIVVKSKLHQAANWRALNDGLKAEACINESRALARSCRSAAIALEMDQFIESFENWIRMNFDQQLDSDNITML